VRTPNPSQHRAAQQSIRVMQLTSGIRTQSGQAPPRLSHSEPEPHRSELGSIIRRRTTFPMVGSVPARQAELR
jgi:hypothetical protein